MSSIYTNTCSCIQTLSLFLKDACCGSYFVYNSVATTILLFISPKRKTKKNKIEKKNLWFSLKREVIYNHDNTAAKTSVFLASYFYFIQLKGACKHFFFHFLSGAFHFYLALQHVLKWGICIYVLMTGLFIKRLKWGTKCLVNC